MKLSPYLLVFFGFIALVGQSRPFVSSTTGGIRGTTVADGSGEIIPNAKILCIAQDGKTRVTYSDSKGIFRIGLLQTGAYKLVFSKEGHSPNLMARTHVRAGAWVCPSLPIYEHCGNGWDAPVTLKASVESYEYPGGHTFVVTSDELSRLPIR
jgi:hypothetical protein